MQYRLSTLFLLFVVLWSSLAVFGPWGGLAVFALVVGLAVCIVRPWFLAVLLGALALTALLLPAISCARAAARQMMCKNNMKQITLALYNYRQRYGSLPPPCVCDKNGKPMHSWRVLILPFFEGEDIYRQYHLDEPWDSPNNKKLLNDCPRVYACPGDAGPVSRGSATSYLAVVGTDCAWPTGQPRGSSDPALGAQAESTVMLIEIGASDIAWTEPKDFSLDRHGIASGGASGLAVRCPHSRDTGFFFHETPDGAHVACVDGHVDLLPAGNFTEENVKRLLVVGGFKQENIVNGYGNMPPRIHWPHCIALLVWCASVGWLFYRAVRSRKGAGEFAVATAGGTETTDDPDKNGSDEIAGS